LFFAQSKAQDAHQSISWFQSEIRASLFDKNDYGHKMLNSMAITNVKGLKWVYITFEGRILIQTEQSEDGHVFAYSKMVDSELGGDKYFREFNIDSLLIPKAISGVLSFSSNGDTIHAVPIEMLLTGGVIDLGSVGISLDSLSKLDAHIHISEYIYTEDQYRAFLRTSRLINFYYAYTEVLNLLVDEYTSKGISKKQSSAYVFNAWHEISRVNRYVKTYGFESGLYLRSQDPLGFQKVFAKSQRLERRANTIFKQVLETQAKGSVNEKQLYCHHFADISKKYSDLSSNYQPYIAAGFLEVMRMFPDTLDKEKIIAAEAFYDVFNKLELASTPQCIYNEFLEYALLSYENDQYVEALDFLYNAKLVDNLFTDVLPGDAQQEIYVKTLDKLMSAYLRIAIIAYRSGNFIMADSYYRKAHGIYSDHIVNLSSEEVSLSVFLGFIEQQVELAYGFLADDRYYEGLELVDRANTIATRNNLDHDDILMDSAYSIAYFGIYQQKLDSLGMLINKRKTEMALGAMEETLSFAEDNEQYLSADELRFQGFALILFEQFYNDGMKLLRGSKPEKALFSFLEARSINDTYLHKSYPDLDSLIYHATVPVILDLTKKAEFEVWANRIGEAYLLYEEAIAFRNKYYQGDNGEINEVLESLLKKISEQTCINLENHLFEIKQKVSNRLRNQKYTEARSFLDEAEYIVGEKDSCMVDTAWISETYMEYRHVFSYEDELAAIRMFVENENYRTAVERYYLLMEFAEDRKLSGFGIKVPGIVKFAKQAGNPYLMLTAAEVCTEKGALDQGLACLELARKNNLTAKETRTVQERLGHSISQQDNNQTIDKKEKVSEYTGDEKWYRYFRSAYLSD
jgi:hypothetical protein